LFPLNQWYVAGFSWELEEKPVARTLLNRHVVLFRLKDGSAAALEDRCCHRGLPLSFGTLESRGIRCGYHGLLFNGEGRCIEIPGQERIPEKACVRSFPVEEQDQIVWIWMGSEEGAAPDSSPPAYPWHNDARYEFRGDVYHYEAPYYLIHDNLMDLSHLGYVHLATIGGNPTTHMTAEMRIEQTGDIVKVRRWMKDSIPPKTYTDAWPFAGKVDRWQEIEFDVTHLRIWTGAAEAGAESLENPERGGFHMRGLHGITPETDTTTHYFWTIASNHAGPEHRNIDTVFAQTAQTFGEDKVIVEAQHRNLVRFPEHAGVDIHVDGGANRARRVVQRLSAVSAARTPQAATSRNIDVAQNAAPSPASSPTAVQS